MRIYQVVVLLLCIGIGALAYKVHTQSQEIGKLHGMGLAQLSGKASDGASHSTANGPSLQSDTQTAEALYRKLERKEKEILQLKSILSDLQAEAESSARPADPGKNKSDNASMMANMRKMLKDPATRDVIRAQSKLALDMNYGGLFEKMLITPEALEGFKDLLVDKQMAIMEMVQDLPPGDRTKDKERSDRLEAINGEYNDRIRLAIGENSYETYREYEETLPDRMQVNIFKQQLTSVDRLTERQEEDLIAAMHDERTSFYASFQTDQEAQSIPKKLTEEEIEEKIDSLSTLRDNYISRAQDILSEPQLIQFERSSEQWRGMQEMSIRMSQQSSQKAESAEE